MTTAASYFDVTLLILNIFYDRFNKNLITKIFEWNLFFYEITVKKFFKFWSVKESPVCAIFIVIFKKSLKKKFNSFLDMYKQIGGCNKETLYYV
jgi:hypothetical protein